MGSVDDPDGVTATAHAALAGHDWSVLPRLLHPYLHWIGPNGATIRGRNAVLEMLASQREPAGPPAAVELRDGQIYRWLA